MIQWLKKRFERRSHPSWSTEAFDRIVGPGLTWAGVAVTPERAVGVPAVYACLSVLSQDVAKTPLRLRQRVAADTFEDAVDHDLFEILHALPNPETSAYSFKQTLMFDLLQYERAYAEIVRVDGRVVALWRLEPGRMRVDRDETRRKRWTYTDNQGTAHVWTFDASMPPILELSHPSPLRHCRELIATAVALQHYVGTFFANGARLNGVLTMDGDLGPDAAERLSEHFASRHGGLSNTWHTAVLTGGLKYQQITAPNDQAQLNETLQTIRTEIAGMFRLPPWKLGDLSKATFSNMETGAIEYVTGALDPYFTCWEHAIRRDVLTTRQYGQFDVIFDRNSLIRSDMKSLHEALARGRDAGYFSVNDVRRKLGENPIPVDQGGDLYLANANLKPLTEAGKEPNVA